MGYHVYCKIATCLFSTTTDAYHGCLSPQAQRMLWKEYVEEKSGCRADMKASVSVKLEIILSRFRHGGMSCNFLFIGYQLNEIPDD